MGWIIYWSWALLVDMLDEFEWDNDVGKGKTRFYMQMGIGSLNTVAANSNGFRMRWCFLMGFVLACFKKNMQMILTKTGVLSQHKRIYLSRNEDFNCCWKTVAVYPVPRVYEERLTDLQRSGGERMIQYRQLNRETKQQQAGNLWTKDGVFWRGHQLYILWHFNIAMEHVTCPI